MKTNVMNRKFKSGFFAVAMLQIRSSFRHIGCWFALGIGVITWSPTLAQAQEAVVDNKVPSNKAIGLATLNNSNTNQLRLGTSSSGSSFRSYPKTRHAAFPSYSARRRSPRLASLPKLERAPKPVLESTLEADRKSEPVKEIFAAIMQASSRLDEGPSLNPPSPAPIGIAMDKPPAPAPISVAKAKDKSPSFSPISIAADPQKPPRLPAASTVWVSKKTRLTPRPRTAELTRYSKLSKTVARFATTSTAIAPRISSAGDEAFTEPIEAIEIAAAENGIIGDVAVKRGDSVETGDLLFELDMTVLEISRKLAAAKANSTARLKSAEVEFAARNESYEKKFSLLADRTVSIEEVSQAKVEADRARRKMEAIIEEHGQANLETKRIETLIEQRRVRSPINGVVVEVKRKPGEYVSNSDRHVATVVQLDRLRVEFHVPTVQAESVRSGDVASLLFPETGEQAQGVVQYVAPITDAVSGRVRVEVLIENKRGEYRSGVRCRILQSGTRQAMLHADSTEPQADHH